MQPPSDELHPARRDAIHRALLCGLLGNVGQKADAHEYSGVRGRKFHLFPESALFRRTPPWVVSAEMVETTRLYARTVAPVNPLWIERAAAHLVKRTHVDPHWSPQAGKVLAYERVTLHGLVLVPRRKVHYGPIDPKLSHEIFVHHALVLCELGVDAAFLRHNRELIEQVQAIEAKARRRDVLVDPTARFAFYDARVPHRIYTADEFERWRRQAEKRDPRVLFMTRRHLMLHEALGVTDDLYPDHMVVNGMTVPLEYRFEPGDRADGITATVPLAALNQLPAEPFDWLVPGYRAEKFTALIRTLPKALRVKFVPAPQFAQGAARELTPEDGPALSALATYLGKATGEAARPQDFQPDAIMDYLRMNFRVVDASGTQIMMGRDLEALRRKLSAQARRSFAEHPVAEFHRDSITGWDFDELPQRVEVRRDGLSLIGYPAVVDAGESVSLWLFDEPQLAEEAMRGGLRRLFMLQLGREMHQVARDLDREEQICLQYAPLGNCDELKTDLLAAIADRAFFADDAERDVRTREAFADRAEAGWRRLASAAIEVTDLSRETLDFYHAVNLRLSETFPPLWSDSIRDMKDQLDHLVYRDFVANTPFAWLRRLPRYLRGIDVRLAKLGNAGLTRDVQAMADIKPLWDRYKLRAIEHRDCGIHDAELQQYRWMLEELRVSLFAQELRVSMPVSVHRALRQWEMVEK